jgi:GPH family glycoside/pentoside/hexuronide:cation symporter
VVVTFEPMGNTAAVPPAEDDREQPAGRGDTTKTASHDVTVPLRVRISYGAPGFAGAAMAIPIAIHLSIFYSDVVLVPLGLIAIVKAVARAFDALTDPIMGWLSDRTRSRWGRRRPWIFLGAPLAALAFVGMLSPPRGLDPTLAAGWLALTYTLYYLFQTVYQIPHYGLGPEITQDYRARASLYGWSEGFSVAGTLVAAALPGMLASWVGDERSGMVLFAITFALLLTLLYWNLVVQVKEREDYVLRRPNPLVPGVRRVMRNRVFRLLLTIYLIGSITGAIPGTMMPFFTKYVLQPEHPERWLGIFLGIYFGAAFVFMPFWVFAVKRFGKKPVWVFSFASSVVGLLAIYFFVGQGDYWIFSAILVWTGSTFSARLLLGPAIQADVIDYDELTTGKRREAQYGGLWSIMTKFTVIPSMSVPLAVLATLGYEPNVAQSETVQWAIGAIFALAPAATALIALPLAINYPIDERVHGRILEGIERHRRGESAVDPLTGKVLAPHSDQGEEAEARSWFLDHFSRRELRRAETGGRLLGGAAVACVAWLALCVLAVWAALRRIDDVSAEPGLLAVAEIIAAGVAFTAFCYHAVRVRAARLFDSEPPTAIRIRAHIDQVVPVEASQASGSLS